MDDNQENVEVVDEETNEINGKKESNNQTDSSNENSQNNDRIMGVLCYLGFIALIPYLMEKKTKFVKFHSIQGMNLFIIELIGIVCGFIPFIGNIASTVIGLAATVVSIIGIVNVLNGEQKELPIVSKFNFIKK